MCSLGNDSYQSAVRQLHRALSSESPGQHRNRYSLFQIVFQQHTSLRVNHNWLRRCEGSLKSEPAVPDQRSANDRFAESSVRYT